MLPYARDATYSDGVAHRQLPATLSRVQLSLLRHELNLTRSRTILLGRALMYPTTASFVLDIRGYLQASGYCPVETALPLPADRRIISYRALVYQATATPIVATLMKRTPGASGDQIVTASTASQTTTAGFWTTDSVVLDEVIEAGKAYFVRLQLDTGDRAYGVEVTYDWP